MNFIITLLLSSAAVYLTTMLTPGTEIDGFWTAIIVSLVLGLINTIIRPILTLLTLPITIITLGLFSLVLSVLLIMVTQNLIDGFMISGFWTAALFGIVLSIVQGLIFSFTD